MAKSNSEIPWLTIVATTAVTASVTYFITSYLREREQTKSALLKLHANPNPSEEEYEYEFEEED